MSDAQRTSEAARQRIFLVVVDESAEMPVALYYASRRARNTGGRVALLYVIQPAEIQQWAAVEQLMREERRQEAEQLLQKLAKEVNQNAGAVPVLYVREGARREELLKLIDEDPSISILVLGASTGSEGPGPLITYLAGKGASRLKIPLTIVPGGLTKQEMDAIA
jgi:nucleotide-binding universal stress UspA family protein